MADLNPKQKKFCEEYMIDLNGSQAVIRAGYSKTGSTVTAVRLLANPSIHAHLQTLVGKRAKNLTISPEMVLSEIASLAFTDFTDLADFDGETVTFKKFDDLTDIQKKSIQSIKVKRKVIATDDTQQVFQEEMELKMFDKVKGLELLGRHLGMFKDQDPDQHMHLHFDDALAKLRSLGFIPANTMFQQPRKVLDAKVTTKKPRRRPGGR